MPVIRQGDHHRINGLIVEHPSKIRVGSHLLSAILEGLSLTLQEGPINIAKGDDPYARHLPQPRNELMPSATYSTDRRGRAQSNHGDINVFVGTLYLGRGPGINHYLREAKGHPGGYGTTFEETSARECSHRVSAPDDSIR